MSDISLKSIADLLKVEFTEQFYPIKVELLAIRQSVNSHTNALDIIIKNTANWNVEMKLMNDKLEKQEKAIKLLAQKLNLDLEAILH